MFIRPNEFEAQLATAKTVVPVYKKSHRAAERPSCSSSRR